MSLVEEIEQLSRQIKRLENELEHKKLLLKQEMVTRGDYVETITPKMKQSLTTINKWLKIDIPKRCYYDKKYCHIFIGKYIKDAVKVSRDYYKKKQNL